MREEHYNDLIRFYHDELSSNLKKLSCNPEAIVPWDLLQDHLRRFGRLVALISLTALPVMMAAGEPEVNVDSQSSHHEGQTSFGGVIVTNQKKQDIYRRVADVIEDCNRLGYL